MIPRLLLTLLFLGLLAPAARANVDIQSQRIVTKGMEKRVVVEVTVKNYGSAPEAIAVHCKVSTDSGYARYADSQSLGSLAPGESKVVSFETGISSPNDLNSTGRSFTADDPSPTSKLGSPRITYHVEVSLGAPPPGRPSGGAAPQAGPAGPDLRVDSIYISSAGATAYTPKRMILISVANAGSAPIKDTIEVRILVDGSTYGRQVLWNGLGAGQSVGVSHDISEALMDGHHRVEAIVDPDNRIQESNEGNNRGTHSW